MYIAIISDTHMPKGRRRLPERCRELLADAALILHAGDFNRLEILRQIETHAPVRGVHGNNDDSALRGRLPERDLIELGGARIGIVHDSGSSAGRLDRLRRWFPMADAVVFGHSHMPLHEIADGFQIFNPGSPTERRRAPECTMGLARLSGGALEFELVSLGR